MSDRRDVQRAKRDKLFLKGPVSFGWIKQNIPDPTARLILVARAFMNMSYPVKTSLALTLKEWDSAGINNSDQRSRVLKNIDKDVKDYWVERRPGRTSVLHHSLNPNKKTLKCQIDTISLQIMPNYSQKTPLKRKKKFHINHKLKYKIFINNQ